MKLLQKEGTSGKNVPMLLLFAVGVIEFLFITLESQFSGIGYYLAENYVIVPCLLMLGYGLQQKQTPFARRRLILATAAIAWFVIAQCMHTLSGMENHPMGTVFLVYLMAFPFASLADDHENAGLWMIGGMFVTAALVMVGYSVLLVLDLVPGSMEQYLFWDGARLNALWHPNIVACYLMTGIGFSLAFCIMARKKQTKVLLMMAVLIQMAAMALTNCRTTILLTGALLGGVAFFRFFRGSRKQLILGLLVAAVLVVGSFKLSGALFQWNNDRLLAAYSSSQEEMPAEDQLVVKEETGIIQGDNEQGSLARDMFSLNGRTLIWGSALSAIRDNKSLAIWGTEYPGTVISVYNPFAVVHSHNSWMEALLRMGLPGLLLSLAFTLIAVRSAARLVFGKETELWKKIIAMMTMCVMAAGFLEPYLFITNVYYHVMDFTFFFLTGYLDYWCGPPPEGNV